MTTAVVGKRKSVEVQFGHQQTCNPRQHEGAASEGQEALSETCGHHKAETYRAPPNGLQLLKQVKVGVGVSRDVFFDQRHANVQTANAIGVVSCFNDSHQFVIHDQRCRFQPATVLAEREFNHVFALERENGGGPNR